MSSFTLNQLPAPTAIAGDKINVAVGGTVENEEPLVGVIAKVFRFCDNPTHPMDCSGIPPVLLRPTVTYRLPFYLRALFTTENAQSWNVGPNQIPGAVAGNDNVLHVWALFRDLQVIPCAITRRFRTDAPAVPQAEHHWRLDENAGVTANDTGSSGNKVHGTHKPDGAGPTPVEEPSPAGGTHTLMFDGSDDFVEVPSDGELDISGDFTLALWTKWNSESDQMLVVRSEGTGENLAKWIFGRGIQNSGHIEFHINADGLGEGVMTLSNEWIPSTEHWHHLLVRRSGTTWTLFIDGCERETNTAATAVPNPNVSMTIGRDEGEDQRNFSGLLSDVRLYKSALTDNEIRDIALGN